MRKIEISKSDFIEAANSCHTRQELADKLGVTLSVIKKRLSEFDLSAKDILKPKEKKINIPSIGQGIYGSLYKNRAKYDEEMYKLYKEGKNDSEIARIVQLNHVTVRNWRIRKNLDSNFEYKPKFDENKFIDLYNQGLTYVDIAKELNTSNSAISEYARSLGLSPNKNKNRLNELSSEEFQVFLGCLLGDGYLRDESGSGMFAHSLKQAEYFYWKYNKLRRFCGKVSFKDNFNDVKGKWYACLYTHFKVNDAMGAYYNKLYHNKIKYIDKSLIDNIEPLGIAVWIMDDGCYDHGSITICTNCFTDADIKVIQEVMLTKFNLHWSKHSDQTIRLRISDFEHLKELITPYMHYTLMYKLGVPKTPLNRVNLGQEQEVPVLNPLEIEEKAKRLEVTLN